MTKTMDNQYWLEGKVSIPEKKRAEFNENILKLLRLCGIRKLKELEVDGKIFTVVHEPKPDDKGIVKFDYSIFEKRKREISYYDTNTCELYAADRGYMEFGVVMNLVMAMQEAYSTEHCYLMKGNQVCDVYGCALLIKQITGMRLLFTNRENIWDMLLFFKSSGKYHEMTHEDIWDKFPYGYGEVDLDQLLTCWIISDDSADEPKNYFPLKKSDIKQAKTRQKVYYAYELFRNLIESKGNGEVTDFLKNLLELDITGRERLAQKEDEFGNIAEISLYELPACIVAAYGWAIRKEFWEVWFSLGIAGYKDIYKKKEKDEKEKNEEITERKERLFYKVIQRRNEDEFLEFWDDQELCLSDDMRMNLEEWKRKYEATDIAEAANIQMEPYLADILSELQNIWDCRYVDEELIKEFIVHSDDIQFKKALLVFRKMMDWNLEYFPEFTAGQVKEWITKRYCSSRDRIQLSGYASLLMNRIRRFNLLGF